MNKELKFRCWDKNHMIFLRPIISPEQTSWCLSDTEQTTDFGYKYVSLGRAVAQPEKYEIHQFTGQKDSKGVEIYENDIVRYWYADPKVTWTDLVAWEGCGWVLWHYDGTESGCCSLDFRWLHDKPTLEVVGNFMENKELLDN